ncbi:MAG: hypothetical protein KDC53_13855, partial [Saprospiraceae bacterium]|nr:hypothetical protein [Saprospiraceae bacterium]
MNFTDRLISVILIASLGMGYFRGQAKTETDLWRIEISMPDAEYKSMKKKSAVEFNFNPQTFSINGQQVA